MLKEKMIEEIKDGAACAIHTMSNSKLTYLPDDKNLDNCINAMRIAQNKDKLAEAYYNYIVLTISLGYSDAEIIAGIMQNTTQNEKFGVCIDSVVESLITIKTPVTLSKAKPAEPVVAKPEPTKTPEAKPTGETPEEKVAKKIKGKFNYVIKLSNGLSKSANPAEDLNKINAVVKEAKDLMASIDKTKLSNEEVADLESGIVAIDAIIKMAEGAVSLAKLPEVITSSSGDVGNGAATNTLGFNIGNFMKGFQPQQQPKPVQDKPKSVFPHQIDGLTDDQIVEEVSKHFKLLPDCTVGAYPMYDLCKNKILAKKMKELNAKQRANNPFLTQQKIEEYIDVPELLDKYNMCFTIPCNDKGKVIVVLFNPVPVDEKNGLQYPIHIFKAGLTTK